MWQRSANHGAFAVTHRSFLLRELLLDQSQRQTILEQFGEIASTQIPTELREEMPSHLLHQGALMAENLKRDFLVVQRELKHRNMQEDLDDQPESDSEEMLHR